MIRTGSLQRGWRRVSRTLPLLVAFALVAGCASDDADPDTDAPADDAAAPSDEDDADGADDDEAPAGDVTLRIAMGSPGEAQIAVWEEATATFEERNPGVSVELNILESNLYETIGLHNLLNSGEPPDIYFEWAGERLANRYAEGFAADISDELAAGSFDELFDEGAYKGMTVDDQIIMVPGQADVTTVMFYNVGIFDDLGLTPPGSWEELLAVADTIKEADIVPIASGNRDLWAAGNWAGHLISRVIGEEAYDAILTGEQPFDSPEVVEALEYLQVFHDEEYINASINAADDSEGAQLFFQGQAAMHPIGSWLVSWAIGDAPDLEFDFFNLPPMPGEGVQDSVIAVTTGYVVNPNSEHIGLAVDFLEMYSSPEFTAKTVDAGGTPLAQGALDRDDIDDRSLRLMELLEDAGMLVAPPDVGYDLRFADALYEAAAEVLGGASTPAEAASSAQERLDR